jgi:hypothetical protein
LLLWVGSCFEVFVFLVTVAAETTAAGAPRTPVAARTIAALRRTRGLRLVMSEVPFAR